MPIGQPDPSIVSSDQPSCAPGVLRLMLKPRIAWSALKVSMVVGTVLNVINNGDHFWTNHSVNLWQAALNSVVPFCVSSYSAARNQVQIARGD